MSPGSGGGEVGARKAELLCIQSAVLFTQREGEFEFHFFLFQCSNVSCINGGLRRER